MKTWLYKIAVNVCRNMSRSNKNSRLAELNPGTASLEQSHLDALIDGEKRKTILSAIDSLPFKQKEVVILRIYEGYSFREIATLTNTSENSAKVNFHHAVNRLKELIGRSKG